MQSILRYAAPPAAALLAAASLAAPAAAASSAARVPVAPTTLAGLTSQHMPSFFKLSKSGERLVLGSVALNLTCASGGQFAVEDEFTNVPIKPNGALSSDWAAPPTKSSDGYTSGGTGTIEARLSHNRLRLTGTWRVQQTFISPTGQSDQCDSGPVRFTATS
jgi:hypothetical protein